VRGKQQGEERKIATERMEEGGDKKRGKNGAGKED
jgi:hypothetical protein